MALLVTREVHRWPAMKCELGDAAHLGAIVHPARIIVRHACRPPPVPPGRLHACTPVARRQGVRLEADWETVPTHDICLTEPGFVRCFPSRPHCSEAKHGAINNRVDQCTRQFQISS